MHSEVQALSVPTNSLQLPNYTHVESKSAPLFPSHDRSPLPHVAILIAAYNEERFIGSVVLSALRCTEHVVVVDDGSQDETAHLAEKAGAHVIRMTRNQGKAAALQTGIRSLVEWQDLQAIVLLDGDGQHDPREVPVVVDPILNDDADLVVGSRFLEVRNQIPWWRQIGQHGLTFATNFASGVHLTDSQSGYRALSIEAARRLSFRAAGFSIESEMQFSAGEHGLRVKEVPVSCVYEEPPKRNPVRHGMQVLDGIIKMVSQMRPLLFFGIFASVVLLAGLLVGIKVVADFEASRELAVGHGLITVMLIVMGSIFLSTGVMLHALRSFLSDRLDQ